MVILFLLPLFGTALAQFTAKYEVRLALSSTLTQGDFGNIEGANALCDGPNGPWYPLIGNSSGLNPDIINQLDGKYFDQFVVRMTTGKYVDVYMSGASIASFNIRTFD